MTKKMQPNVEYTEFEPLKGMVFSKVENINDEELIFRGKRSFRFYHEQGCCEFVRINDICGDLSDLEGAEITQAEEATSHRQEDEDWGDSQTWTFYRFSTKKGAVTVRWLGESNGYYSERVDFEEIEKKGIFW